MARQTTPKRDILVWTMHGIKDNNGRRISATYELHMAPEIQLRIQKTDPPNAKASLPILPKRILFLTFGASFTNPPVYPRINAAFQEWIDRINRQGTSRGVSAELVQPLRDNTDEQVPPEP